MDISFTGHPFPQSAPFRHTIIIVHLLTMSLAFLVFYPYSITQQSHTSSHKRRSISLAVTVILNFVGFVTGWFIHYSPTTSSSDTFLHVSLKLSLLLLTSLNLALEYISSGISIVRQHGILFPSLQYNDQRHQQQPDQQHSSAVSSLFSRIYHVPEIVQVSVKWVTLYLGYFYLVFSVFVLTSTSGSIDQWWLPLAMGVGFILYGSLAFMLLVNIINLHHHSNIEYYEALMITAWGILSFLWWDTTIVGSSWKAINVGLLWTTGGILSLAITFQSWMPMLQKRNVINSIIICLTGKGILTGYSNDDEYGDELQTTLGYILVIAGVARFTQIIFRKSTTDNLPRLYARTTGDGGGNCDDTDGDDDDTCVDGLDIGNRRVKDYELTYRQLTGIHVGSTPTAVCKHQSVYASITMICSVLSSFMAVSGGLLFIGAIPEWVEAMRYYISDPSTYVNVLLAISFLWTTYLLTLCSLYKTSTNSSNPGYLDDATADYYELPTSSTKLTPSPGSYYDPYNMSSAMAASTSSSSSISHPAQLLAHGSIPATPCTKSAPPLSKTNSNGSTSPPMRPSQYRAKRRSLLISTSMQNSNNQDNMRAIRTASTSGSIGVGGILPDEVSIYGDVYASSPVNTISLEQLPTTATKDGANDHQNSQHASSSSSPTIQRRSWRSSASSLLSSSPPRMNTSPSKTLSSASNGGVGHSYSSWQQQQPRNGDDGNHAIQWTVYKTESGKRKERHWKNSKRPQAVAAASTMTAPNSINGHTLHADELQQDNVFPTSGESDGRGQLQSDSDEFTSSDSRIF